MITKSQYFIDDAVWDDQCSENLREGSDGRLSTPTGIPVCPVTLCDACLANAMATVDTMRTMEAL